MNSYLDAKLEGKVTRKTLDGKEYLVVNATGLVTGAFQDILYSPEVLWDTHFQWDGVPVTLNHPDGFTANTPENFEKMHIGKIFNSSFEGEKLVFDLYLDVDKLIKMGHSNVINQLEAGKPMDVSVGMRVKGVGATGRDEKGKQFGSVAKQIAPDHLALLPNSTGACSQADGCGVFMCACGCSKEEDMVKHDDKVKDDKDVSDDEVKDDKDVSDDKVKDDKVKDEKPDDDEDDDKQDDDKTSDKSDQDETKEVKNTLSNSAMMEYLQLRAEKVQRLESLRKEVKERCKLSDNVVRGQNEEVLNAFLSLVRNTADRAVQASGGDNVYVSPSIIRNLGGRNG